MANYPTATYSPSAVTNGDIIDASRDNAQDAEITAVENALLTGLAHGLTISTGGLTVSTGSVNVGGPSSLATLQVNGASTFTTVQAGASTVTTLQVTGASSFTGAVTFATRPVAPMPDLAFLTGSTSPFANNSSGGVFWPTQNALTNSSLHSTATNADRVSPQSTGAWMWTMALTLSTGFAEPSTGTVTVVVKDSSGGIVDFGRFATAGGKAPTAMASGGKRFDSLAANPYVRAVLIQTGGSTASLDASRSFLKFYKL